MRNKVYLYILPFITVLFLILLRYYLDIDGITSYIWSLGLFYLANNFAKKTYKSLNFTSYHIYLLATFIMYVTNFVQFPLQEGLTGGDDIVTDDTAYYYAASGGKFYGFVSGYAIDSTPFVILLRFLHPFSINNPINLLIINALIGLAFLPYLSARVAETLFNSESIAHKTYYLTLFCPFCWSGGLILMRDVPSAVLILLCFLFYITKRYKMLVIPLLVLLWLKFGFVVFLVVPIMCYELYYPGGRFADNKKGFVLISLVAFLLLYYFVMPMLSVITGGKMEDGDIFRSSFTEHLTDYNSGSLLAKIYTLPVIIRLPLLIASFFLLPLLRMPPFGIITFRSLLSVFFIRCI